jgi:DNA-binding NtrC family response regulator
MVTKMKNPYRELGVRNILLIEDDPWSVDSLSTFFRIMECPMQCAVNAMEAIAAVSRDRYDLILCEYQLPGMNGLVLLKMLGDIHREAVRILFTSYPVRKLTEEAARSGIHEVIRKPFTVATLEEALARHFPRVRQEGREPVGTH